METTVI